MSPLHLLPLIFKQFAVWGVNSECQYSKKGRRKRLVAVCLNAKEASG